MKNKLIILFGLMAASLPILAMEPQSQEKKYDKPNQAELDSGLQIAASKHFGMDTRELLESGANPNAQDGDGNTPLHNAVKDRGGNRTVIHALLEYGADQLITNHAGDTPLLTAVKGSYGRCSQMLIDFEAAKIKRLHFKKVLTFLMWLKQTDKTGVLYKERHALWRPYLQNPNCKPLELLRMKDKDGHIAFKLWTFHLFDPEEQPEPQVKRKFQ